jgi:hypothetical protein
VSGGALDGTLDREQIAASATRYLSGDQADCRLSEALIAAAEEHPAEAWQTLATNFPILIKDRALASFAVEVLDTIRVHGGTELWRRIVNESSDHEHLARAVQALDRYHRKYAAFMSALHGIRQELPDTDPTEYDLPLPNPYDRPHAARGREPVSLTAEERSTFIRGDLDAWERVDQLVEEDPHAAFDLFEDWIRQPPSDDELAAIGIHLLEPLLTYAESAVAARALEFAQTTEAFRRALSSCHLNPSEQFLDELLVAIRSVV